MIRKKLYSIILILAVLLILYGAGKMGSVWLNYHRGRREYEDLKNRFAEAGTDRNRGAEDTEKEDMGAEDRMMRQNRQDKDDGRNTGSRLPADAPAPARVDFDALKRINQDVAGWIELPAVGLSYPIVQGETNDSYLHTSISGEYLFAGCIFLDSLNDKKFRNLNSIVYGHNMRDGSMFAKIREYQKQETVDQCPYFWIETPDDDLLYRIVSVHSAVPGSFTFAIRFGDAATFESWQEKMKEESVLPMPFEEKPENRIVTLSTCTDQSAFRQVVQGVRIAEVKRPADP